MIDYGVFDSLPQKELMWIQAEGVDNLPHAHRSRMMNLSTHSGASGHYQRIEKILATNSFDIDLPDEKAESLYVVFPEISRFNHDCRPNADYYFDLETLSQHIHAIRPIAAGEEISITYIDPVMSRSRRRQKLHSIWGFQCSCSQCTQPDAMTDASDSRVRQIRSLRRQLEDYGPGSAATPQMAELLVSLHEQERLQGALCEAHALAAIEWNGAGEPWAAVRHARLAVEHGLASSGPADRDVVEMGRLAEDPWGHWSWMLRTSKRMSWGRTGSGWEERGTRGGADSEEGGEARGEVGVE
ncbi:SET domain protein [Pleurostoma richardsiae]|uniref:SET domain protein n=1 Tax=Pleurostoma richardsiae TaxID=41990 RepID=A0AA38S2M2_9PEZI|nr:SET domain protein [Pleurostoma richardsiae]